jgi:hydrogenase maturation protein HypF
MTPLRGQALPLPAPARVLACGAFLKNSACLVDGRQAWWSPLHGDLATPEACAALEDALPALVAQAEGPIAAVAHDLHPDFHSTRLALAWAQRLGVPALAVQHHHAHIGVLQAESGLDDEQPLLGLALDGVGLGLDGLAWGGELLVLRGRACERLAHLPLLALPGGDVAAREPWRLVAAVLHALGRAGEIVTRLAPLVGPALARGVATMLQRDLNCPRTSSAGRWFDAAAGVLGLSLRQAHEAEAAVALEQAARAWLARGLTPETSAPSLDLLPVLEDLLAETDAGRGAARFHLALAQGLVHAAAAAAARCGATRVALGGGCFHNRLLLQQVTQGLQAAGLQVLRPPAAGVGDAGLALGQAWVAALQTAALHHPALETEN